MTLEPGRRLGAYTITAKLGEGGMGEVYRATDAKLKRDVAIKVLPAAFAEDKERLARFEREAQLLAQLHHPNIASIFGLEESDGVRALVMELVEGLFYRNGERLMRVDIGPGSALAASAPRLLHTGPFIDAFNWTTSYSVAADGRFLRILPSQPEGPLRSIDVVLNWAGELDPPKRGGN